MAGIPIISKAISETGVTAERTATMAAVQAERFAGTIRRQEDIQQQVATILEKVLRSYPTHPGALHYLLHDYDDPEHAHLALSAARTLAKLATEASHAVHMPSHVFVQLGLWHDAAASDRAAFDASSAWVSRRHLDAAMRNYHSLAWLQYELLQLGR